MGLIASMESGALIPGPPKVRHLELPKDSDKTDKPEWMKRAKARHKIRKGR